MRGIFQHVGAKKLQLGSMELSNILHLPVNASTKIGHWNFKPKIHFGPDSNGSPNILAETQDFHPRNYRLELRPETRTSPREARETDELLEDDADVDLILQLTLVVV